MSEIPRSFIIFIDFQKAFDIVNRNLLIKILTLMGLKNKIINTV